MATTALSSMRLPKEKTAGSTAPLRAIAQQQATGAKTLGLIQTNTTTTGAPA